MTDDFDTVVSEAAIDFNERAYSEIAVNRFETLNQTIVFKNIIGDFTAEFYKKGAHFGKLYAEEKSNIAEKLLKEWLELRDGEGSQPFLGLKASLDFAEKCDDHEKRVRTFLAQGAEK